MAKLIVMAGLPAAGKSSIARELAARLEAMWLRVDTMDQAIWASGTAPADLKDWTYRAAQAVAADNLALGRDVIADCVNDWPSTRERWREVARQVGSKIFWLEVVCSDPVEHRLRVETRTSDIPGMLMPDWNAVLAREYAPWDRDHTTIKTAHRTLAEWVTVALSALA
ncbi:AAA family ATPase [Phenylobacterium sp.]|uniref:AAA family ATPase n=1 Tax=Phenylobacterium sp. TaxID=1871053 RepID=UPI00286AA6FA|nr:AAA family ATPase [Phenylobacterium sp.]